MTFILAEAGVNHNGKLELAYKLIDIAVEAKADAIKFQTFKTEDLVSKDAIKAEYQNNNTDPNESQYNMLKKLELSYTDFEKIYIRCLEKNIEFISSPFDIDSVDFLNNLGVKTFKVGSGELTNYLLLKRIAETGKKIILSTGMCNLEEVENSINYIRKINDSKIILLHCVSCYPTKYEDLNLKCIQTMREKFNIDVGFSDHTQDYKASLYSVALGANYIEKHFTIDKTMDGPDHKASLNPIELKNFIHKIKECNVMLGDGIKKCKDSEKNTKTVARKSLYYRNNLESGHVIKYDDLLALRPYDGICVSKITNIIGKSLIKNVERGESLQLEDIQ